MTTQSCNCIVVFGVIFTILLEQCINSVQTALRLTLPGSTNTRCRTDRVEQVPTGLIRCSYSITTTYLAFLRTLLVDAAVSRIGAGVGDAAVRAGRRRGSRSSSRSVYCMYGVCTMSKVSHRPLDQCMNIDWTLLKMTIHIHTHSVQTTKKHCIKGMEVMISRKEILDRLFNVWMS